MQINIQRTDTLTSYHLAFKSSTLLNALYHIKNNEDNSLTFSSNCRSGVCGTCAMRVNGKEVLACSYKAQDGDLIEPLKYHEVQRDLKVNKEKVRETLKASTAWLQSLQETTITQENVQATAKQTDCILCNACYSACPVLEVNPDFMGPFALTRVHRYTSDVREADIATTIANVQSNGIWHCTLCGECTAVCPQGIDPKMDINMLRGTAVGLGYSDPNYQTMDFGFGEF